MFRRVRFVVRRAVVDVRRFPSHVRVLWFSRPWRFFGPFAGLASRSPLLMRSSSWWLFAAFPGLLPFLFLRPLGYVVIRLAIIGVFLIVVVFVVAKSRLVVGIVIFVVVLRRIIWGIV